ncbi:MAG: restriction system protein [Acidobacteriota bacterium]|nr:restriction system protein [Acidobacteriota bacterium]
MRTDTLQETELLLRQTREYEELKCISVSFKYRELLPIEKWIEVILLNITDEPFLNMFLVKCMGVHPFGGGIPYKVSRPLIADRLEPLEDIVLRIPLWMNFVNVYLTIEFMRKGKKRVYDLLVGSYPDKDDWESHGVYNLLDYGRRFEPVSSSMEHTKFSEILKATSHNPELIKRTSPERFEELIAELFSQMGFNTKRVGKTGDGGVDIYAVRPDVATPTIHLIQCKRYSGRVGVSHIRELYGVKSDSKTNQAVFVTTSGYTRGAKEFAERNCWEIRLIDFEDIKKILKSSKNSSNSKS